MCGSKSYTTKVFVTIIMMTSAFFSASLYAGGVALYGQSPGFGKTQRETRFSAKVLFAENYHHDEADNLLKSKNAKTVIRDNWFSYDKGYHVLGSFMLTVATSKGMEQFSSKDEYASRVWAASITIAFGIGKELFDSTRILNHFSYKDFIADLAGITLGLVLLNNE